ncbi:S2/P23 family protein (plasmid) [Borreliella finlandensis]|uniref:S2/P23 family protein n=1 Tax=Borreliella finlandensis TaxID=498741 RepID=UPI003AF1B722
MKKGICILNIFFFISFFYSCLPAPESSKNIKTGIFGSEPIIKINKKNIEEDSKKNIKEENNNTCSFDEESRLNEIKEGEVYGGLLAGYVTWAKSGNLRPIKDKHNNLIKDLEGLKYSYIFSPIQLKTSGLSYTYHINDDSYTILGSKVPIAKIIAFESTKEFEEKYEVKSLRLISEGSNIDFERYRTGIATISLKEASKESGYINSYNFVVFDNALTDSFRLFYKKSKCSHMLAHLTIKDKQTHKDEAYEIALNLKLFNDTIKLIFTKYPNLSNEKLKLFINE